MVVQEIPGKVYYHTNISNSIPVSFEIISGKGITVVSSNTVVEIRGYGTTDEETPAHCFFELVEQVVAANKLPG